MGWPSWVGVVIPVALILDGILISDALYQIVQGKPSVIPFERVLRKRAPATPADCVLQGVAKLLIYVGVLLIQLPLFAVAFLTASGSPGASQPGGLLLEHAVGIALMVCAGVELVLVVSAAIIESRVHFTSFGRTVNEH